MQRMIQSNTYSSTIAACVVALATSIAAGTLQGQGPARQMGVRPMVRHADADFEASGYVTPAGMVPPSMYHGSVQPVGYCDAAPCESGCCGSGTCDSGGCNSYGGCQGGYYESYGGCDSCGGSCGPLGCGGILGKLTSDGSGMSSLRHLCCFCRGGGCSACQYVGQGYLLGALRSLLPYGEAGLCAQRWYDLSAEALFLSHNSGSGSFATTSLGNDTRDINGDLVSTAPRVMSLGDADNGGELEAGMRLSAAMIFGAGGNLEGTYLGNNSWNSSASVVDPNAAANDPNFQLFSFISSFGSIPANGFDDTDRSRRQTISFTSEFHSGELNYRRRTVGPYCRFQGSWLVGLRYLSFENGLGYMTRGGDDDTAAANLPRFFSSSDEVKNEMWGPQAGFDLWWNVIPGINVGFGMKGAWVQNDIQHRLNLTANSLAATSAISDTTHDTTVIGELEAKIIYRLSHSWSLRSSYYLVTVEDAGFGSIDRDTILNFIDANANPNSNFDLVTDDLVLQGFSIGAEYLW